MYAHQSTEGASRYAKQIEQTLNEIESKCNEKLYLKRHMLETLREYLIRVRNNIRQQTSLANQPLSRSQKSRFMNIVAELSKRLSRTDDQLRVNEECLQRYHRLDKVIDFLLMLVDRLFKDTTLCCDKYQYIELTNSPSI